MRIVDRRPDVTGLPRRVRRAVLVRSLAVQGSWNYRTLIGFGFAYALLPALRALYGDRPEELRAAVERHRRVFNSHPYLAPVALGAVAALEAEGAHARTIERFKTAVRGSLGTLGDRLVWAGWRPVCLLGALALLLVGAPWWAAVGLFLVVYNAAHVFVRWRGFRAGLRSGPEIGARLRGTGLERPRALLDAAGAFLVGLVLPLVASGALAGGPLAPAWIAGAALAAGVGARVGAAVRTPAIVALALFALVGILLEAIG